MKTESLKEVKSIEEDMKILSNRLRGKEDSDLLVDISEEALQEMVTTLIKIYDAKVKGKGDTFSPVSPERLSQTETTVFLDQLLRAMDVELFEMQIWRSLGSSY